MCQDYVNPHRFNVKQDAPLMALHGILNVAPSLVIYAPIIDFDWAVFVRDNQNNKSLLGEGRI